jgi:hypothetical protein
MNLLVVLVFVFSLFLRRAEALQSNIITDVEMLNGKVSDMNGTCFCAVAPDANGHVKIPPTWTVIGNSSFNACAEMRSIEIPPSVMELGAHAFSGSGLVELHIPDTVQILGDYLCFFCIDLITLTVGRGVSAIPHSSFTGNYALVGVDFVLPSNITTLCQFSFYLNSNMRDLVIPDSVKSIQKSAFSGLVKMNSLKLGSGVTSIDATAFAESHYKELVLHKNFQSAQDAAFGLNILLKKVTIDSTHLKLGQHVFLNCISLLPEDILWSKSIQSVKSFEGIDDLGEFITIDVPSCNFGNCNCSFGYGNTADPASGYFTCKRCEAGQSSSSVRSREPCADCTAGRYQSLEGQSKCLLAPAGTYSPSERMTEYKPCPKGTYSDVSGLSACKLCPHGSFNNKTQQVKCDLCSKGKYNSIVIGADSDSYCVGCEPGKYSFVKGADSCQNCGKDTYTDWAMDKTACRGCPSGFTTKGVTSDGTGATYCIEDKSPCVPGQERNASSQICTACSAGKYSDGVSKCKDCPLGSYSEMDGTSLCTMCSPGKFGDNAVVVKNNNATACIACPIGRYQSVPGMISCFECPPGSFCRFDVSGLKLYEACEPGKYQQNSEQYACLDCPPGSYQSKPGQAACYQCNVGRYNPNTGSSGNTSCIECPVGTYANQNGTRACHTCSTGSIQALEGQVSCIVCADIDSTFTSNTDHTECVVNKGLLGSSVLDTMFESGVALSGVFIITAAFIALGAFVTRTKEQYPTKLSSFTRFNTVYNAGMAGFTFGSDVFLIFGVLSENPGLGAAMLFFRCLHVIFGSLFIFCIYGSFDTVSSVASYLEYYFMKDVLSLRKYVDEEYSTNNVFVIESLAVFGIFDITMLQFLPWHKSHFFDISEGYPTLSFMKTAISIKTIQSMGSIICEICYLSLNANANNPTTSSQAEALFILNIVVGILTLLVGIAIVMMRGEILKNEGKKAADEMEAATTRRRGKSVRQESITVTHRETFRKSSIQFTDENPLHTLREEGRVDEDDGGEGSKVAASARISCRVPPDRIPEKMPPSEDLAGEL